MNAPLKSALVAAALALCATAAPTADRQDKWQEETLLQLSELRKAQGELKQQVADLRAEVATLRSGARPANLAVDLRDPLLPSLGAAAAPIAIVEFSDFQCPYCRRHQQATLPRLNEKYLSTGKARYFFVDYPLSFHSHALQAAIAGACAHRQGAFWRMHERLFESQAALGRDLYLRLAGELSLDRDKFQQCFADPDVKRQIDAHLALGERAGVQGTPAFVIGRIKNGILTDARALSGARSFEEFSKVLDHYASES